jgi:hypothetical protein
LSTPESSSLFKFHKSLMASKAINQYFCANGSIPTTHLMTMSKACHLVPLVSCLTYFWTLKTKEICYFEMLGSLQTTYYYKPEDRTLQNCNYLDPNHSS